MHALRISIVGAILMSLAFAPLVFADNDNEGKGKGKNDNADSPAIQALQDNIKKLKEQLEEMLKQRKELLKAQDDAKKQLNDDKKDLMQSFGDMDLTKKQLKFVRSLVRGMSGDDVKDLQELLAQDPEIFDANNITGFFGPLTEAAVRKFQKKHGIESIGIFGPKTQARILALFVGKPLPPGIVKRLGLENSSTTPGAGFVTVCHKEGSAAQHTLVIAVPALGAHLAHGDSVGVCAGGGTGTTTPDTTKPVLTNINSSAGTSTATITWTTNEAATSHVNYGLSSGYGSSTTNSLMVTSHSMMLTGLVPSTLYHFMVQSADGAGNHATSSDMTFTTNALPVADTTAPTISAIATSTTASAATITWTTDEAANSHVYYSTASPVSVHTATHAQDALFVTSHSMPLAGLTASTTYYFLILGQDAAGNNATSSEMSFMTL